MAKCKVCGTPHAACGPRTTVVPVDQRFTERKQEEGSMALKRYEVVKPARGGDITAVVKLTDEEAKRLGAKPVGEKQAAKPADKAARKPANKGGRKPAEKAPAPAGEE